MCVEKFQVYLPILIGKGFSLKLKGRIYTSCVRCCLIMAVRAGRWQWSKSVSKVIYKRCSLMENVSRHLGPMHQIDGVWGKVRNEHDEMRECRARRIIGIETSPPYVLHGRENRVRSISWPEVVKGLPGRGYSHSYRHSSTIQLKADQYGHANRLIYNKKCNYGK